MAAGPPITGTVAIALILGLDAAPAVIDMVIATALVPFTLPPLALWLLDLSSVERRVGTEGVSKCRPRWSPYHKKTNESRSKNTIMFTSTLFSNTYTPYTPTHNTTTLPNYQTTQ